METGAIRKPIDGMRSSRLPAMTASTTGKYIDGLRDHSQLELEAVESYERSHKGRERVLNKLRYMRGYEPFPGYDALSVEEILAALEEADLATIKKVRGLRAEVRQPPPGAWTRSSAFTGGVGKPNLRSPRPVTSRSAQGPARAGVGRSGAFALRVDEALTCDATAGRLRRVRPQQSHATRLTRQPGSPLQWGTDGDQGRRTDHKEARP